MKKEFYESYCIRIMAKVNGYECFVSFIYADEMRPHVYENGKTWLNFYSGEKLVACLEESKIRMTAKQFQNDEWAGYAHFDYDYVQDLQFACE